MQGLRILVVAIACIQLASLAPSKFYLIQTASESALKTGTYLPVFQDHNFCMIFNPDSKK